MICRISGLSNKGELVPVSSNPILVQTLTRKPIENNSQGLIINQIQYTTPKIDANIISVGLTITGRGSNLKLDMLEAVMNVAEKGKLYQWAEHLTEIIKHRNDWGEHPNHISFFNHLDCNVPSSTCQRRGV